MFELLTSIILGIIQGLGEFLPISSSGHLVLVHQFLSSSLDSLNPAQELAFDVALHLGTLLAVLFFFRNEISHGLKKIFKNFNFSGKWKSREMKLVVLIVVATIPGALAGYFLDSIVGIFRDPKNVAAMLLFYGILLLAADKYYQQREKLAKKIPVGNKGEKPTFQNLSLFKAFIIGVFQALAFIPGTSRSGITITGGLFLGLSRRKAAVFSFILSIPIIAGAALVKMPALFKEGVDTFALIAGISVSFAVGFFAIKYMLKYLTSKSYLIFVLYRMGLAVIIFWLVS